MPPAILVALLPDRSDAWAPLQAAAEAWAPSLPHAAFFVCEQLDCLEPVLMDVLAWARLPLSRLLVVGVGRGGARALSLAHVPDGLPCAGVLAYDAIPEPPADAAGHWGGTKIRLLHGPAAPPRREPAIGEAVRRLQALGVDVRGTVLQEAGLTRPALRLGAAYLTELAAAALDGPRHPQREDRHAP